MLKGYVDAVNVTDNQTAIVRMSSIAACVHSTRNGFGTRRSNGYKGSETALPSNPTLWAPIPSVLKNILCLSGDHQTFGSQPDALNVFDIDSMNLARTVYEMREEGKDMSGHQLANPPKMFIGAAANPFADPFEYRVIRLAKKIEAGVDFIQTQCVYNMESVQRVDETRQRRRVDGEGLHSGGSYAVKICGDGQIHGRESSGNGCSRKS